MIEEAIQAVVTALDAAGLGRGDGQPLNVTDFMPLPGGLDKPCAVVVAFSDLSDVSIGVSVTLVVDTSSDPESAERLVRSLCPALDGALDGTAAPRSDWSKTWSPEFNAYMVATTLVYPRDDF